MPLSLPRRAPHAVIPHLWRFLGRCAHLCNGRCGALRLCGGLAAAWYVVDGLCICPGEELATGRAVGLIPGVVEAHKPYGFCGLWHTRYGVWRLGGRGRGPVNLSLGWS